MSIATTGQRDVLVTIQTVTRSVGPSRQPVETWTALTSQVWMAKKAQAESGRFSEQFTAGQLSARAYTEWTLPYRADMDPDLVTVTKDRRLLYKSRVYDIVQAELLERGGRIKVMTLAKVG